MIFSKYKSPLLGFIAIFLLAITIKSCTEKELIPVQEAPSVTETPTVNIESTSIPLAAEHPILIGLKASEDVQCYNTKAGQLLWDGATMMTYDSKETLPLILVPIDNGREQTLSFLVAAYNEEKATFHAFINSIDLPSNDLIDEGYTGIIEYKTVENVSAIKTAFHKGKIIKQYPSELTSATYRDINLQCFTNCITAIGLAAAASGLTNYCSNTLAGCIAAPAPANPYCIGLVGCAFFGGGAIASCAWSCWR